MISYENKRQQFFPYFSFENVNCINEKCFGGGVKGAIACYFKFFFIQVIAYKNSTKVALQMNSCQFDKFESLVSADKCNLEKQEIPHFDYIN